MAGLAENCQFLGAAQAHWPALSVVRAPPDPEPRGGEKPAGTLYVDDDRAEVWIGVDGRVEIDRASLTVRFLTAKELADQVVVHPYLGLPAAIASRWLGRQILHGGAFIHRGRAWAVLGDKEAGKSSTLGWLFHRGYEIVSDDVLVIEEGTLYSGPRCIDLRPGASSRLGGENVGMVGNRVRWRLHSGEVPAEAPLGGVVVLDWGDEVTVESPDAGQRLEGLIANSALRPRDEDAASYLDLAALPTFRFVRPRDWGRFDEANDQLIAALP